MKIALIAGSMLVTIAAVIGQVLLAVPGAQLVMLG